jgi:hypothetical protein
MRVWSPELKVGKNGIRFRGLYFGQYNADLLVCYGKMVRLAYDPDDMRQVYVYDVITWKLITMAEQNQFINYGSAISETHLRSATQQKARCLKTVREYRNSSLVANMDLTDIAMRAREAEQASNNEEQTNQTLRPVQTPLDGQIIAHKQLRAKAKLTARPKHILELDFSLLEPQKRILPHLNMDLSKLGGARSA